MVSKIKSCQRSFDKMAEGAEVGLPLGAEVGLPLDAEISHRDGRSVVEIVKQIFHDNNFDKFNISEIIKGGSEGCGTGIDDDFDLDLVMYSRDLTCQMILDKGKKQYRPWLIKIRNFLKKHAPPQKYIYDKWTRRSLQFTYDGIDVDFLVSPYFEEPRDFYDFLGTIHRGKRGRFTVCAAKWQVEFFKHVPSKVKEMIRKAKEWRNAKWPKDKEGEGRPSSYLMSLLVVAAYDQVKRITNVDDLSKNQLREKVRETLIDMVKNADRNLDICWADGPPNHFYKKSDYLNLLPSQPRIMDPANPANNVWVSGIRDHRMGRKPCSFETGNGSKRKRRVLQRKIHTITLK